ncbi:Uncharacterised protein [Mycobacteroides abscessus subsp. massiliense]|nr:Uncharacterised protein [Mycobacteroides abscessus subsp. massiliense]
MLQTRQPHAFMGKQEIADFDDGWRSSGDRTEKFHTHSARVFRHFMQHEGNAGDDAVRAFFLHAGQAAQEFVGNVFAQTDFAEFVAGDFQTFGIDDINTV